MRPPERAAAVRIMVYMFSRGNLLALCLLIFLNAGVVHAQIQGSIRVVDLQCESGYTGKEINGPNGTPVKPLASGAECLRTPVGDNEALGLECSGIENPVVISKCDAGKCVAKIGCDGKPLTGTPNIPTNDPLKPAPLDPNTQPPPVTQPDTTPVPITQPDTRPVPINPGPGGSGGGITLPSVDVTMGGGPGSAPRPGSTFSNTGAPSVLAPGSRDRGGVGGIPTVFDMLFPTGSNTTFTGSFGSSGGNATQNLFASFFSNILSNLLSGLFNFGGSGVTSAPPVRVAQAGPPSTPGRTPLDPALDSKLDAIGNLTEEQPLPKPGTGQDRTGLENVFETQNPDSLMGPGIDIRGDPSDPGRLKPEDLLNPDNPSAPEDTRPIRVIDVADATPSNVQTDVGIVVPNTTNTPPAPNETERERVMRGLREGTIAFGSEEAERARTVLRDEVARLERIRDREYLTHSLGFAEWRDSQPWVPGFLKSSEQQAVEAARAQLDSLASAEGIARLRENATSISVGLEVDTPRLAMALKYPTEFVAQQVTSAWEGVKNWWGSGSIASEMPVNEPTVPPTPAAPTAPVVPAASAAPAQNPPTILDGLSAVAKRVYDGANRVAWAIGLPVPPPTLPSAPLAASNPSQATAPPRSTNFMQGGMNLLSALISGVANLFNRGSTSANPGPAALPAENVTAVASITANPIEVSSGASTRLAWASVGANSCAIVDSLLNVIARGASGATSSPSLQETTRFGIICDVSGGSDKFLNEVLVRVTGSASTTAPLFSNSGRASTASAGSVGSSGGSSASPSAAPIDVRTCDPEQSIDTFIKCLCEAEPNPNGCLLVP